LRGGIVPKGHDELSQRPLSILAQYSECFLQVETSIETQCQVIIKAFDAALYKKIWSWSGKAAIVNVNDDDGDDVDRPEEAASISAFIAELFWNAVDPYIYPCSTTRRPRTIAHRCF
jgi:hypothetical protein